MVAPKRGTYQHKSWVIDCIVSASADLGKKVAEISRAQFRAMNPPSGAAWPSREDLDALGGWSAAKAAAALSDGADRSEMPIREWRRIQRGINRDLRYTRSLEREIGDSDHTIERLRCALSDAVVSTPPVVSKLPKRRVKKEAPADVETVAIVSDTHFGLIVDAKEVPGQAYNWTIASRRMALFCEQIAGFKPHHREHSALRLLLGGDIIEGEIHSRSPRIDFLASQVDGARQILTSAIDYLRHHYSRIHVECTPGNHDRWAHHQGRALDQKWDGLATILYRGLQAIFRDCDDVKFNIPRTPYCIWRGPGDAWGALTHYDTVVRAGNPGKRVNVESIDNQMHRLNEARAANEKIRVLVGGHVHVASCTAVGRSYLLTNGPMVSVNPYAQSLGIHTASAHQLLWEWTDTHPVGDMRIVQLNDADNRSDLSAIVAEPTPIGE